MVMKNRPIRAAQPNNGARSQAFADEGPVYPAADDDIFEDLIAGLTGRPETDVGSAPVRARRPSIEGNRLEETAARGMASKLAPNQKPRTRRPRPMHRKPKVEQSHSPEKQVKARAGIGRRLLWSLGANISIAAGLLAAFILVEPLNNLLPKSVGGIVPGISADTKTDVGKSGAEPLSSPPQTTAAITTVSKKPFVASAAPKVVPRAAGSEPDIAEKAQSAAAAGHGPAPDLRKTAVRQAAFTRAAFAMPASPLPSTETVEVRAEKPALRQIAQADEPTAGVSRQPVAPSLSEAQIERYLDRGAELLEAGDIVAARLLFMRIAEAGDRRGAKGVAMTYDPNVYAHLPVAGLKPDPEQAAFWYEKAGVTTPIEAPGSFAKPLVAGAARPAEEPVASSERNAACARKYNSFDPSTGLYLSFSGVKRPCKLP